MGTTTLEEPNTRQQIDPVALAADREREYQARRARLIADVSLDDRLRERLIGGELDEGSREIWGTKQICAVTKLGQDRISKLRANVAVFGTPHPSSFPPMDAVYKRIPGWEVIDPGTERGAVEEWCWLTGRLVWNHETGDFEVAPKKRRHGRKRTAATDK